MSTNTAIKIAIADDHKIFRDGIKMALSGKKDLKMIWEAEDGKDMLHKIEIKKVVILNLIQDLFILKTYFKILTFVRMTKKVRKFFQLLFSF